MAPNRLEQLHKLHQQDPQDPFCTYGIALELAKIDDIEQALTWLDKTLALDDKYFFALFQKGKLLSKIGQREEAKELLQWSIDKARSIPNDADAAHAAKEMANLLASIE